MRWFSLFLFISIFIGMLVSPNCNTINDEFNPNDTIPVDTFKLVLTNNIKLQWKVENAESLHIKLSAPTTGWVAIGFDSIAGSKMKGMNFIIGYVTNDTMLFIQDDYGNDLYTHVPDTVLGGIDNINAIKGTETDGRTEIEFKIPLNSGDRYDRILIQGNNYSIRLAYGPIGADDFTSFHIFNVQLNITI